MKAEQHIRTVEVHGQAGDVVGTKEVVLYAGLLNQAHEEGLARIKTAILQVPTPENGHLAIIKAEVETEKGAFEAIGDACPESVDEFLAPHLIRVAETRAKARALRMPSTAASSPSRSWTAPIRRLRPQAPFRVHRVAQLFAQLPADRRHHRVPLVPRTVPTAR